MYNALYNLCGFMWLLSAKMAVLAILARQRETVKQFPFSEKSKILDLKKKREKNIVLKLPEGTR